MTTNLYPLDSFYKTYMNINSDIVINKNDLLCRCGCGNQVTKIGNKFITGRRKKLRYFL